MEDQDEIIIITLANTNLATITNTQLTSKAIYVRVERIDLNLHTDVLIGNIQICILGCVLQKSRVATLQACLRLV